MKKVSAIIVNWNGKEFLAEAIGSLLKQDYSDLEILVSDNGSEDGSVEYLRETFPTVRIVENKANLGFGTALNRAMEHATGDYFLFLNNDLSLKEDCVRHLAQLLYSDNNIGATVPKILFYEKPDKINSFGVGVNYTGMAYPKLVNFPDSDEFREHETACGGIFMMKREAYEDVGGFEEDFFLYHEDHDLSWRMRLRGWKIMVTPKAVLYHHYHFNKGVRKFYHSERNRLYMLIKNYRGRTLLLVIPALILIEAVEWVHAIWKRWFILKLRSYVEITFLLPQILIKSRKLQRRRKIDDRQITSLFKGTLNISGIDHPWLENYLSPALDRYWNYIQKWI